jgi:hypothetical protein
MHQKLRKSELARKFDGEIFVGSKTHSFLKLYMGCSGPGRIRTLTTMNEGMCIHML